jgi:hypothetical protein
VLKRVELHAQGDDDVVALHFDVEVGFIRHLVDTNAKAEWRLLHAITSRGAAMNPCVAEPLPLEGFANPTLSSE